MIREILFAAGLLLGLAAVIAGVAMVSVPLAFVFSGLGIVGLTFLFIAETS